MIEHRFHKGPADPLAGPRRWVTRPAMPPVSSGATTAGRERGELDLAKLAAAAAIEADRAARRGKPLVKAAETISSSALKALATQAKRELARLHANCRADNHRTLEG